jgi:hypothetical protein
VGPSQEHGNEQSKTSPAGRLVSRSRRRARRLTQARWSLASRGKAHAQADPAGASPTQVAEMTITQIRQGAVDMIPPAADLAVLLQPERARHHRARDHPGHLPVDRHGRAVVGVLRPGGWRPSRAARCSSPGGSGSRTAVTGRPCAGFDLLRPLGSGGGVGAPDR